MQVKGENATYETKTGDWVKVTSKLGVNFAIAPATEYARQLVHKDVNGVESGTTYVITYSDAFNTIKDRSMQVKEDNATYETKTGDWVKVTSKLGVNFDLHRAVLDRIECITVG